MSIKNEKELGKILKTNPNIIIIEGDLTKKVLRIIATGRIAWIVAIGAIAVAVGIIFATGGLGILPTTVAVAPVAVSTLGLPAALSAVGIAIAGGGVAALNKLRKYKVIEKSSDRLVLKRD